MKQYKRLFEDEHDSDEALKDLGIPREDDIEAETLTEEDEFDSELGPEDRFGEPLEGEIIEDECSEIEPEPTQVVESYKRIFK